MSAHDYADSDGPLGRTIRQARAAYLDGKSREEILAAVREGWEDWPAGARQVAIREVERVLDRAADEREETRTEEG